MRSALQRLAPGGRLVAITGSGFAPGDELAALGTVVFTAPIAGNLYRRRGTNVDTRLTIIDRVPAGDTPRTLPAYPVAESAQSLLDLVTAHVPARRPVELPSRTPPRPSLFARRPRIFTAKPPRQTPASPSSSTTAIELAYSYVEPDAASAPPIADTLYEPYRVETIRIEGAQAHPTTLVQSAAMASVRLPRPNYRPHLPPEA